MAAPARFSAGSDEVLLAAILEGARLIDAAERAGMNERTARRRLADPSFRERLDAARAEVVTVAVAQLAGLAELATSTQRQLLTDDGTPAAVKRAVAKDIHAAIGTLTEVRDLEARLETLERAAGLAERAAAA